MKEKKENEGNRKDSKPSTCNAFCLSLKSIKFDDSLSFLCSANLFQFSLYIYIVFLFLLFLIFSFPVINYFNHFKINAVFGNSI